MKNNNKKEELKNKNSDINKNNNNNKKGEINNSKNKKLNKKDKPENKIDETNNTKEAEMYIDKALINAPHDQIILYFKSCIYAQKSDKIRAFAYLKKAVENGLKGKREIKMDKVWQKYLNDREFKDIISNIQ